MRTKEDKAAYQKMWREKNHDRFIRINRDGNLKYRTQNHDLYLDTKRKQRQRIRLSIIEFYGGKCVKCGITDWRVLQVDHINGGGCVERKKYNGSTGLYYNYKLINTNPDLCRNTRQLLCANCNTIKKVDNGEYAINGISYYEKLDGVN